MKTCIGARVYSCRKSVKKQQFPAAAGRRAAKRYINSEDALARSVERTVSCFKITEMKPYGQIDRRQFLQFAGMMAPLVTLPMSCGKKLVPEIAFTFDDPTTNGR